jgi:hypothetical protein
MTIKILGIFTGLLGLAMIVCSVMTWREMQSAMTWRQQLSAMTLRAQLRAMTSESAPTAYSMPLTKFVCPEFFESSAAKPAELPQVAVNRIYIIGGGSFVLVIAGIVLLVLPRRPPTSRPGDCIR